MSVREEDKIDEKMRKGEEKRGEEKKEEKIGEMKNRREGGEEKKRGGER